MEKPTVRKTLTVATRFGDQNELRSFSDIWEDGMPGYLIWLWTAESEVDWWSSPSAMLGAFAGLSF